MSYDRIGVIGAMDSELAALIAALTQPAQETVQGLVFHTGRLGAREVVLVRCGIGKVSAARCTQVLIDRFAPGAVINTGIAGAVHHDLKVLDVVISRELCYHDFNARFLRDYPPYIDGIHASELMVESAVEAFQQIDHGSSCCFVGKIATGDQFIESADVKNKIVEEHHPMCVEMEGAAIGHTCCVNDIPFVIIRTMSDNADEEAAESATNFEETAARHSAGIVMQMLSSAR